MSFALLKEDYHMFVPEKLCISILFVIYVLLQSQSDIGSKAKVKIIANKIGFDICQYFLILLFHV
jgi:hypothetical protein